MATYTNQLMVYVDGRLQKISGVDALVIDGGFTAGTLAGDGSALTALNASNIASGVVGKTYLPGTVAYTDDALVSFSGTVDAVEFTGGGSGITSLDASNLTSGTVADARLSGNVALLNAPVVAFTGALSGLSVSGDGAGLTNLDADHIASGTVNDSRLSANVAKYNDAAPTFTNLVSSSTGFSGDGSLLTNLTAANISGTLSKAQLPATTVYTDSASTSFDNGVSAASFSGNGASLTSLNAGNITTGTLADARLTSNVAKYDDAAPHFTGVGKVESDAGFMGDGSSLTNLNASNLSSGTVADARLSANVAKLNAASNAFTGDMSIGGSLNVTGPIISGGSVEVVLSDSFLDLNGGNTTGAAKAGGFAVNVQSFGTLFDGVVTDFTAGSTGVDPYLVLTGDASALTAGDLIQISGSPDGGKNDGQYLVVSADYNTPSAGKTTVTVKGDALSANPVPGYMPFAHNQFVAATGASATLTAIRVGVMGISNGALYASGHAAIAQGVAFYGYGEKQSDFDDKYVSLAPAAAETLQGAYDAGNVITLTDTRDFVIDKPALGNAAISLNANANSDITIDGAEFSLNADRIGLGFGNVVFDKAGVIMASTGVLTEGTVVHLNSSSQSVASDNEAVADADREVAGVVTATNGDIATVAGTNVRVAYSGSAPVAGDIVYLSGGANAGTCQVAVPTSGRVTRLGQCIASGVAGLCTVVWNPQYIADL